MSDLEDPKDKKHARSVSFDWDTIQKIKAVIKGKMIPGVPNRSALIEYALSKVFTELKNKGCDLSGN